MSFRKAFGYIKSLKHSPNFNSNISTICGGIAGVSTGIYVAYEQAPIQIQKPININIEATFIGATTCVVTDYTIYVLLLSRYKLGFLLAASLIGAPMLVQKYKKNKMEKNKNILQFGELW